MSSNDDMKPERAPAKKEDKDKDEQEPKEEKQQAPEAVEPQTTKEEAQQAPKENPNFNPNSSSSSNPDPNANPNPNPNPKRSEQSKVEIVNPLQVAEFRRQAPGLVREYFRRISRKQLAMGVKQPENWRVRPRLPPPQPPRNMGGSSVPRGGSSTAPTSTAGASTAGASTTRASSAGASTAGASTAPTSTAGASTARASTARASTARASTARASAAHVSAAGASDEDAETVYRRQPTNGKVLTWSSYLRSRRATMSGVQMGRPAPTANTPTTVNCPDLPASESGRELEPAIGRNQGGHRGIPAAERSGASQTRDRSELRELQSHQSSQQGQLQDGEPPQNNGSNGQRNQGTSSGFSNPPTHSYSGPIQSRGEGEGEEDGEGGGGGPLRLVTGDQGSSSGFSNPSTRNDGRIENRGEGEGGPQSSGSSSKGTPLPDTGATR